MRITRSSAFLSLVLAAIATVGTSFAVAQPTEEPTTMPATAPTQSVDATAATDAEPATRPARRARAARLTQPWSRIADQLSDEQKQRIIAIHAERNEKLRAIDAEEMERCMALLTDEQKVALQEATDRAEAERKARNASNGQQQEEPAGN